MRSRGLVAVLVAFMAVALIAPTGRAARDPAAAKPVAVRQELIVLEAPNCTYCAVFRRDVLPAYQRSTRAGELPIRFLDLNDPAADELKLAATVNMVPTIVLMREGAEVERISGYIGPDAFFATVARMVNAAE